MVGMRLRHKEQHVKNHGRRKFKTFSRTVHAIFPHNSELGSEHTDTAANKPSLTSRSL